MECAESCKSLVWVSELFPLEGALIEMKWAGPRSTRVKIGERIERFEHLHNRYAVIAAFDLTFILTSNGSGPMSFKASNTPKVYYANNILSAWAKICRKVRFPNEVDEEDQAEEPK